MSSHREAPEISKDPNADNTDVYAFVSPDAPDTVTLIANFLPFELPYGGPNFYEFADDVVYDINISNSGDGHADITYRFQFTTTIKNPNTFLYNTGPITRPTDATWNRPQTYNVTRITRQGQSRMVASNLLSPPVNVGVHSTPNYPSIAARTYHTVGGRRYFAGQRADAFHVDLGSVFDLGVLRPFQAAFAFPPILANMPGVNGLRDLNVHTLALQVPIRDLTADGSRPRDVMSPKSVIGVWASASRSTAKIHSGTSGGHSLGTLRQVSRQGQPLINEVIIPMAEKDYWNTQQPYADQQFAEYVVTPELAGLLPVLYPNVFPHLAAYRKPRNDLLAILMTGIPGGIIPGFQNFTGPRAADLLRLNVAIPPATPGRENPLGILGGDLAGYPNGRRLGDDTTAIQLRAVAGATIPLVDKSYTPDAAAGVLVDGTTDNNTPYGAPFLPSFPYLSNPNNGYTSRPGTPGGDM